MARKRLCVFIRGKCRQHPCPHCLMPDNYVFTVAVEEVGGGQHAVEGDGDIKHGWFFTQGGAAQDSFYSPTDVRDLQRFENSGDGSMPLAKFYCMDESTASPSVQAAGSRGTMLSVALLILGGALLYGDTFPAVKKNGAAYAKRLGVLQR
eukprot:2075496-Rhodomonas_salina.1